MFWVPARDGDAWAYSMYRRHYSSRKNKRPKVRLLIGPGEKLLLVGWMCNAIFAWQKQKDRWDGQAGVNCTVFRNESGHVSSEMILEAMTIAWEKWPGERLFTMVDPKAVRSSNPGYCFLKAGWRKCGTSKSGKVVLEAFPDGFREDQPAGKEEDLPVPRR